MKRREIAANGNSRSSLFPEKRIDAAGTNDSGRFLKGRHYLATERSDCS